MTLLLLDLKHFKTIIMSSYKTFQSVTKCHKVSQSSLNTHLEMVVVVSGGENQF